MLYNGCTLGRDGLPSQCILLHSDSEFLEYGSGFYTNNLSSEAKERHMKRIESMRKFVNSSNCRRVEILRHFEENAPYTNCNTCDNCAAKIQFADDSQRDFADECAILFSTVNRNPGKVWLCIIILLIFFLYILKLPLTTL